MYEYIEEERDGVRLYGVRDFGLSHVFDCGQCFRWNREEDGSYSGVAFGRSLNLSEGSGKKEGTVLIRGADGEAFEKIWKKYFDLERDYGLIKDRLTANDPVMKEAAAFGAGIRILNQDEWETLISFIISQNRNIPLIKKSVEELSRLFGEPVEGWDGREAYAFPSVERLAELNEDDIGMCRLGYRTRYVIETAKAVAENPDLLYDMTGRSYEEAFDYLRSFCGVGPKVANCVLLFSMEKYASFPVDVWVRRLMSILYGSSESDAGSAQKIAADFFGDLGGFAQQYLFYYAREKGLGK